MSDHSRPHRACSEPPPATVAATQVEWPRDATRPGEQPVASSERLRVLIVDDEAPARQRLRDLLEKQTGIDVAGEAATVEQARRALRHLVPDLVFLDIQLRDGSGFDLIAPTQDAAMPEVIFVTAFDHHAVRAFEAQALDYLLKPFDDQRFTRALTRACEAIRRRRLEGLCGRLHALLDPPSTPAPQAAASPPPPHAPSLPRHHTSGDAERLVIRSSGRVRLVAVEDINWIEAAGTYVRIHSADPPRLLRQSLSRLEARLQAAGFVRIHRSTIVNTRRIRELRPLAHGEYRVVLEDGTALKLSRSYRDRLDHVFTPGA